MSQSPELPAIFALMAKPRNRSTLYRLIEADHYINKRILVVGGGDSAVEAALGLAHQSGNQVTLSYRQAQFSRIKERNSQRVQEAVRSGKLKVLFNSAPLEFTPESVILDVAGDSQILPNDFVWIFAGGTPPNDFLKKIGVQFGSRDTTLEASNEAKGLVTSGYKANAQTACSVE